MWVSSTLYAVGSAPNFDWFQVVSCGRVGPALRPIFTLSLLQREERSPSCSAAIWALSLTFVGLQLGEVADVGDGQQVDLLQAVGAPDPQAVPDDRAAELDAVVLDADDAVALLERRLRAVAVARAAESPSSPCVEVESDCQSWSAMK